MSSQGDAFRHEGTRGAGVCFLPRKLSWPPPSQEQICPRPSPTAFTTVTVTALRRPASDASSPAGWLSCGLGLLCSAWGGRGGEGQALAGSVAPGLTSLRLTQLLMGRQLTAGASGEALLGSPQVRVTLVFIW